MEKPKKEMNITEFNAINTQLSELLTKLNEYEHTDLTNAKKLLKEAGTRISNYFYRIFESNELITNDTENKTN